MSDVNNKSGLTYKENAFVGNVGFNLRSFLRCVHNRKENA